MNANKSVELRFVLRRCEMEWRTPFVVMFVLHGCCGDMVRTEARSVWATFVCKECDVRAPLLSTDRAALRPRHINEGRAPPSGELVLSHFVRQVEKKMKWKERSRELTENTATVVLKSINSLLSLPLTT